MKRFQTFLPNTIVEKLRALSEKTGLSIAEHIRRALDDYLVKK